MLERLFVRQDGALRPVAFALAFRRSDGDLRQPLRKLLVRKNGATRPVLPPRLGVAIRAPWWKLWLARYDTPPAGWPLSPGADHPPQAQGVLVLLCVDGQTDPAFLDRLQQCGGLQAVTNLTVVPRFTPDVADTVRQKARAYWPDAMPDDAPDRIAVVVGFGIGMFAIALLLWRARKARRQRSIDEIIRHAEANSPYSDIAGFKDESFVEIDLSTLHRMN